MGWAQIFNLVNLIALIAWAVLLLAPRRDRVIPALRLAVVGAFCAFYTVMVGYALAGGFGSGSGSLDFSRIEGVRSIFASDGGVVVGWTHYLAFDLFVGLWIAGDADRRGLGRIAQAPILFLTFMVGPAGPFAYGLTLLVRRLLRAGHPAQTTA